MHGDEADTAEAKRIIELEERLERGDAHCFLVVAHRAEDSPEERTVALINQEASVAREKASSLGGMAPQQKGSPPTLVPGRRLGRVLFQVGVLGYLLRSQLQSRV